MKELMTMVRYDLVVKRGDVICNGNEQVISLDYERGIEYDIRIKYIDGLE
jgi:hypothetical protein